MPLTSIRTMDLRIEVNVTKSSLQLLEEILDWKVKTKQLRRSDFVWPYDLGPGDNWRQVVTASGWPLGNGVEWKVIFLF